MKVLLIRDVENLGKAGEVKTVADGYARNFLIPKGMAILATESVLRRIKSERKVEAECRRRAEEEMKSLAEAISQTTLTIKAKAGEKNKLYGSITRADIADALEMKIGKKIDKRKVELKEPIRELGVYFVPIKLTADLVPEVVVAVERE
jgi:large subunit ribosomal protein L9